MLLIHEVLAPRTWAQRGRDLLRQLPGWLGSLLFHGMVLVLLAIMFLPKEDRPTRELVATSLQDEDLAEPEPITIPQDEQHETESIENLSELVESITSADSAPAVEVADLDSSAAISINVELQEIGLDSISRTDLMSEVGGVGGRGLEGRSEGGRRMLVAQRGGNAESEAAVARALDWFARHQNSDGSWSFDHRFGQCQGRCGNEGDLAESYNGATGLALLPFLGAGQTHREGKYKELVRGGLYFLINRMRVTEAGGSLTSGPSNGGMYDHAIATIALCEAYAMTQDRALFQPAQAAINYIVSSQDPVGGGWRYFPREAGDTSVVGWQLMALKSGHMGYLAIPPNTIAGVEHFLDSVQQHDGSAYGYMGPGDGSATSAAGLLCRMYLGWEHDHPALVRGIERFSRRGPSPANMYFNYYATQLLHHYEGEAWEKWNKQMRDYLVETQALSGHETGSWYFPRVDRESDAGMDRGGRLYFTAMATMILEVYYRHLPLYRKESTESDFN